MIPPPTEPQPSRTQAIKREVSPAIYLRAYDVINSLDRAENQPWWAKSFERLKRSPNAVPSAHLKPKRLTGAARERLVLPAAASHEALLPVTAVQEGIPVLTRAAIVLPTQELALVRINPQPISNYSAQALRAEPKRISWLLLAVVAVVTAGLTFAIIRLAWPSLSPDSGGRHPKHEAVYISKRSGVSLPLSLS